MNIFNYDNPLMSGIKKIVSLISLSAMWIIFSLPIFTMGASTTALYYAVQKNVKHDRSYPAKEFWYAFKTNFKQATLTWLIFLGVGFFLAYDLWIIRGINDEMIYLKAVQVIVVIMLIVLVLFVFLIFPYIARFKNSIKLTIKNAGILAFRHFPVTLLVAVISLIAIVVVYIAPVSVVIVPALMMWQNSYLLEKVYRLYMTEEEKEREDFMNQKQY